MGPELTRRWAELYVLATGNESLDLADAPMSQGFDAVRNWIDARLGLEPPDRIDFAECRLEWQSANAEGRCESNGHTSLFIPDGAVMAFPEIGTECKLRSAGGCGKVLVLRHDDNGVVIARAPHRQERRAHMRVPAAGYAVVRLGNKESTVPIGDLSEGGVGFDLPFIVEAGQHLDLLLRIEGKRDLAFECEGLVVNCRKPLKDRRMDCWLGVMFTQIPDDMRDAIRKAVREEESDA